ncbi:MAG: sulfatase-like hydrolase/transferase [Planctomycetota bacterium]
MRRNLVIYACRGLRADALATARAWPMATDTLVALGARGLCVNAVAAATADEPARVSLLTGLAPNQHGRQTPAEPDEAPQTLTDSFVHQLADAGYHTAGVGCVEPIASALTESITVADVHRVRPDACDYYTACRRTGVLAAVMAQRNQRRRGGPLEPDRLLLEPSTDIDGFIARRAAELAESLPTTRPWALIIAFSGPGNALPPPSLYDGIVPAEELAHGVTGIDHARAATLGSPAWPRSTMERLTPDRAARLRADYLGRVSLIDYAVKRVDQRLQERSDASRLWSIVASDRGYALGAHGLVGDRVVLPGVVHTPIIVAGPRGYRPADEVAEAAADALVSTTDVAATVADLAVTDEPDGCAGHSLVAALRGQGLNPRAAAVTETPDRISIETARHRLILDRATGQPTALFNALTDPDQRQDLLHPADGPPDERWVRARVEPLKARLADAWLAASARPNVFAHEPATHRGAVTDPA